MKEKTFGYLAIFKPNETEAGADCQMGVCDFQIYPDAILITGYRVEKYIEPFMSNVLLARHNIDCRFRVDIFNILGAVSIGFTELYLRACEQILDPDWQGEGKRYKIVLSFIKREK